MSTRSKQSQIDATRVVAANLVAARRLKGWTQSKAAEQLEPFIGERWSKATWSAAERSVDSGRPRQFSASLITAFARAFDLPVEWFFLPQKKHGRRPTAAEADLMLLHLGTADTFPVYRERVTDLLEWLGMPTSTPLVPIFKGIFDELTSRAARRQLDSLHTDLSHVLEVVAIVNESIATREES